MNVIGIDGGIQYGASTFHGYFRELVQIKIGKCNEFVTGILLWNELYFATLLRNFREIIVESRKGNFVLILEITVNCAFGHVDGPGQAVTSLVPL